MCDTMGFVEEGLAIFAKNSDRSPNEPQVTEYHPARRPEEARCIATYMAIEQVKETHAAVLSRPVWCWGAEMGVNDCGVCIGNEAVFTLGTYRKTGLTGMDLVRLGLERSASAREAVDVILALLDQYGQGGNCGYDHTFRYDNSFLIMDKQQLFLVETAGKHWAVKEQGRGSISNRLSIRRDGTAYSGGKARDFTRIHTDPLFTYFSGSGDRLEQSGHCIELAFDLPAMQKGLRTHAPGVDDPFIQGSVNSVCMHFGGEVGDHTTASMLVELGKDITVWVTGSSCPCVSLFKPYAFGAVPCTPVFAPADPNGKAYWLAQEKFRRRLIGKVLPDAFYGERDALETAWYDASRGMDAAELPLLTERAVREEEAFYQRWSETRFPEGKTLPGFLGRWEKKNKMLGKTPKLHQV